MKILHYTLGLPPYRTGGLTKYSIDLAEEQKKNGEDVSILFPGELTISRNNKIKYSEEYNKIKTYKILNPLPVSILKGIKNPDDFMKQGNLQEYIKFLKYLKPDIIHIHTLMGLHKEFIKAAKLNKIKLIYTTHDYFGICPKVNLIDCKSKVCLNYNKGEKCLFCNCDAPNTSYLRIGTSKINRKIRMSKLTFNLKKMIKKIKKNKKIKEKQVEKNENSLKYMKLRNFYIGMIEKMDCIHYNSNIAKKIFEKYIKNYVKGKILFITHSDIKINEKFKKIKSSKIRLSFLGTNHKVKGLEILLEAFEKIDSEVREKYELNIFGVEGENSPNINFYGEYKYDDLKNIFSRTDFTVIPSTWYETFNFVALESKIFKTAVIISNTIGAKDIFHESEKIEIEPTVEYLKSILENLELLKNKKIVNSDNENYDFKNHVKDVKEKVYKVKE